MLQRSRLYQAQLDVSLMEPGSVDFNRLNDSCIILIAPFDIFGRGLYRYTLKYIRETTDRVAQSTKSERIKRFPEILELLFIRSTG